MAIGTYAELQDAVANWLDRTDLTARIVEFITLGEAQINADLDVRTTEAESALTASVGVRTIALPTGYREPVALFLVISGVRTELRYLQPQQLDVTTVDARPSYWTVDGANVAFDCPCDVAYSVVFRIKTGLAIASATNIILTNYPGLYLFAALKEAGVYLRDNDLIQIAEGKYDAALQQAKFREGRAKAMVTLSIDAAIQPRGRYNIYTDL